MHVDFGNNPAKAATMAAPLTAEMKDANRRPAVHGSRLFVLMYFGGFFAALFVVIVVNLLGNGCNLFPAPWAPSSYERAWKARCLAEAVRAGLGPQVLILGSSRTECIQPAYVQAITGKRTFNYGALGGGLLDELVLLRYSLHCGARPDMIILE